MHYSDFINYNFPALQSYKSIRPGKSAVRKVRQKSKTTSMQIDAEVWQKYLESHFGLNDSNTLIDPMQISVEMQENRGKELMEKFDMSEISDAICSLKFNKRLGLMILPKKLLKFPH
ncbi:hypothetical protein CHUAL_001525 [Chamberlinius hualienensis]